MPDAPTSASSAAGLRHDTCLVGPGWDMVIMRMGTDKSPDADRHGAFNAMLRTLAPAVSDLP